MKGVEKLKYMVDDAKNRFRSVTAKESSDDDEILKAAKELRERRDALSLYIREILQK